MRIFEGRSGTVRLVLLEMLLTASGWVLQPASAAESPREPRVDFRVPERSYSRAQGEWSVYLERSLVSGDEALSNRALDKLSANLTDIFAVLPKRPADELRKIRFFLLWGVAAPGARAQ